MRDYDDNFLKKLNKARLRTHYAKVILLTFDEKPVAEIQGEITGGSINVNSSSAIRRTLSLSMLVNESVAKISNVENQISLNKKIQVEIGLKNPFPEYIEQYGNIVWFPQGVYVLSSANTSRNTNGWSLNITAKDKMSLLDGSAGGMFYGPTVVSEKWTYLADGSVLIEYPILRQIIYEAVNHYGGEDPNNIIINDLEDSVKMLVKYDGYNSIYYSESQDLKEGTYSFIQPSGDFKIVHTGEDVGYKLTDFTYPGELTMNAGETVVNLLDKIVNILGNYEYFYDIDGHFIFQEIRNYVNKQSPLDEIDISNENYLPNIVSDDYVRKYNTSKSIYQLYDLDTTASISQAPKYDNIKNDFYVWGQRAEGVPIHYHLAIDVKPVSSLNLKDIIFIKSGTHLYKIDDQEEYIPYIAKESKYYFNISSISTEGYYFSDGNDQRFFIAKSSNGYIFYPKSSDYDWREELYRQALYLQTTVGFGSNQNYYYEELISFWRDLYDPSKSEWDDTNHWNPDVFNHPENINFWLDFIDTGSEIGKYSVNQIGRRSKVVNKKDVKTIYNKEVPDILFVPSDVSNRSEAEQTAISSNLYTICYLPESKWDLFSISSTGASCFDEIRELLYQHLNYHTTISITCLPVYYLEPNNLIQVEDSKSGIIGNFQITQFSLPLMYNGTMTISATEVFQRI